MVPEEFVYAAIQERRREADELRRQLDAYRHLRRKAGSEPEKKMLNCWFSRIWSRVRRPDSQAATCCDPALCPQTD